MKSRGSITKLALVALVLVNIIQVRKSRSLAKFFDIILATFLTTKETVLRPYGVVMAAILMYTYTQQDTALCFNRVKKMSIYLKI